MPDPRLRATVSISFSIAVERLWAALTDFEHMHHWFVGVRRVQIVEGGAPRVGAHRRVRFVGGHRATELITWWEPPTDPGALHTIRPRVQGSFRLRLGSDTQLTSMTDIDVSVWGTRLSSRVRWQIAYQSRYGTYGHVLGMALVTPLLKSAIGLSLRCLRRRLRAVDTAKTQTEAG